MSITRTAWTDDDGTGTTGTVINNAEKTLLYDQIDAAVAAVVGVIQTMTLAGTRDDFALSAGAGRLYLNNATLLTLTGLAAGADGQLLWLISTGAGQVDLLNQNAGSVAANRFLNGVTGPRSLAPGTGKALLEYDATAARWRVLVHEQGAWISVPYTAGDFTASTGTWTVDAGDLVTFKYLLTGTRLTIVFSIELTSVSATPAQLLILIPRGYTAANYAICLTVKIDDNLAAGQAGHVFTPVGSTQLKVSKVTNVAFATATNGTSIYGQSDLEVQ